MSYHLNMYGIFSLFCKLAEDSNLSSIVRNDLSKAADKILDQRPLEALSDLRAMRSYQINPMSAKVYRQAGEALALTIVSHAQSVDEIEKLKTILGNDISDVRYQVLICARVAGLTYKPKMPLKGE